MRSIFSRSAGRARGWACALACAALCVVPPLSADARPSREPVRVIFDTDMWGDIDDALALAMVHALEDRGEAKLLAVTSSTDDPSTVTFIDAFNRFYGRGDVPIGLVRDGVTARQTAERFSFFGSDRGYAEAVSNAKAPDGSLLFPRTPGDGGSAPDAVALLRRTLAAQPDGSVVVILVGFSTNLARLLRSKGDGFSPLDGMSLVERKVRLLSVMSGAYADRQGRPLEKGDPEFNLVLDAPSARDLFDTWPTPVVASGFEIGASMRIAGASIDRDYGPANAHPMSAAYRHADGIYRTQKTPPGVLHDHATYDLTSVLYGIRPDDGYFGLSAPGKISVSLDGSSRFVAGAHGRHRYLVMDDAQRARTLEAMTLLASQPPAKREGSER